MDIKSKRILLGIIGGCLLLTSIGHTVMGNMPSAAFSFQAITAALVFLIIAAIGSIE